MSHYLQNTYYLFPSKDTTLDNGEQLSTYDRFNNDQTTLAYARSPTADFDIT